MEERVVTIGFDATVAGKKLDVCGANIVLGINEISRIELMVPPTESSGGSPLEPNVQAPSLTEFIDLYRTLAKAAESQDETGSVDITITTNSTKSGESTDRLTLKDWVLSGVGMSSVSATSAPHLSVILHHPAFWLTKVGSVYETPKSNAEKIVAEAASGAADFLGIVDAVYEAVKHSVEYFDPPDGMAEIYKDSLGTGKFAPRDYIRDDTPGPMLDSALDYEVTERLCAAIGRLVCPMGDGSSTWDMLVRSSGTLLLSLVQDESSNFTVKEGHVLEPSKPWKTGPVLTFDEDRCFWTEIPGMDLFKIVGVMARKLRIFANRLTTWANPVGAKPQDEVGMCDVLYCPVQPTEADGRIMKTSAPCILQQAFMEDGIYGSDIVTGFADTNNTRLQGFDNALRLYCRAIFEITYGSMNTGKMQLALGFRDSGGNLILPGNTCKLVSKGSDVYYGYIKSVVHSLSTKGGCSTTIGMSHVRPELKVEKVPDGDINAAYDL